jgi:hypothetical protein
MELTLAEIAVQLVLAARVERAKRIVPEEGMARWKALMLALQTPVGGLAR